MNFKQLTIAAVLSAALVTPSIAADDFKLDNVGAAYGFGDGGTISAHADVDIERMTDMPLKARFGYSRYSYDSSGWNATYTTAYNIFYGGAYYDFSKMAKFGKKIHPFAGIGFGGASSSVTCSGNCSGTTLSAGSVGGLYYIGGVQYDVNRQFDAELSFAGWGGISIGANYNF
ncbi:MAG: hypothetical protein R8M45_01605 [Ghiorsea sp.]